MKEIGKFLPKGVKIMNIPNTNYYQQPSYQAPRSLAQMPIQQTVSPFLKGRLVSSIEEARAQTIDFDGSVFYFPDLANRRIYTKQINLDGTSTLNMYELKEIPMQVPVGNDYVTREEFEQAINPIRQMMAAAQTKSSQVPDQKSTQSGAAPELNF